MSRPSMSASPAVVCGGLALALAAVAPTSGVVRAAQAQAAKTTSSSPPSLLAPTMAEKAADSIKRPVRKPTVYEDMELFSQVFNQIRVNHPDSIDVHELIMAAVDGMVHAADPHSFVIPAIHLSPERQQAMREGELIPVPIEFSFVQGAPVVAGVNAGSAASRLDILRGDELIAIDGQPVTAESEPELDLTLAGEKGSSTTLTFERRRIDGSLVRLDRVVKREKVGDESAVPAAFMLDPMTGYVRITTFLNEHVADDLHHALSRLERRGMQRLVLDLRDNGGGNVSEAARVAGEFLPKGSIVYTAEGRKPEVTDTGRVRRSFWKSEKRYPVVLLVNGGTASASELVAGALQDHDRALIVGRPTFGKALLMRSLPTVDGSLVVLVIGHIKTPCGRVVQREYRTMVRRDYFRLAGIERDTAGRPSCKTDDGRTVYGGGGIYPDVVLSEHAPAPFWLARVREDDLVLEWMGGYISATGSGLATLDSLAADPRLPAAALAQFRDFAARQGVTIPPGAESDSLLQRVLVPAAARVKWGDGGYYRLAAMLDSDVAAALAAFSRTTALLNRREAP